VFNVRTLKNDYLLDGEILTQMSSFSLMFAAFGILLSPII